jgi:hypothetical protein
LKSLIHLRTSPRWRRVQHVFRVIAADRNSYGHLVLIQRHEDLDISDAYLFDSGANKYLSVCFLNVATK